MKDLRIIIVSWNVERLLKRCLESLPAACVGLDWEVVVVDNASHDNSIQTVANLKLHTTNYSLQIIANPENRGFAKACNQGIAATEARYFLLLNPDTECPPESLANLVKMADENTKAGIIGPQLVYPNGEHQPSVRSFPSVWNQAGILLKLHHVFPLLFRRYFVPVIPVQAGIHSRLRGNEIYKVDQPMGACFLIRRELIEKIGGLDERYFIWFEEVDYCKKAVQSGWDVVYVNSVKIIHHGGTSFAQVMSAKKQQMFNESLIKYFAKWHAGWKTNLMRLISPVSLLLARLIDIKREPSAQWILWFIAIVVIEILSLATVFDPIPRGLATITVGIVMFAIARRKPELGLAILLLELAIGSKGALFKIPNGLETNGGISVRIVMVAAFLAGWFFSSQRSVNSARSLVTRLSKPWIVLGGLCVWGVIRGLWLKNQYIVQDANAWAYLALLLPVIDIEARHGKNLRHHAGQAIYAALLWLPIKTLALLYVWSHSIKSLSQPLYFWIRRTGVGEVTLITGNLFRIFMQSQVYAIFGLLFSLSFLRRQESRILITVLSCVSILISLSRSFWIGLFAGLLVLTILLWKQLGKNDILIFLSRIFIGFFSAFILIISIVALPIPRVEVGSLSSLFGSRGSVTDAAAASRWNLLPALINKIKQAPVLGSGFGATVTYESKDPRVLTNNVNGKYTTYAFEWGWLEHWIKFGILGIPVMLWLLASLMIRIWKLSEPLWLRAGFVSSLAALGALHIFTPYLNHPLGFGFLLAAEGFIVSAKSNFENP